MELRKLPEAQQKQIDDARWGDSKQATSRPVSHAMEEHMHNAYAILDHGFIRLVDYMGDEAAIVDAARVSYGRGTTVTNSDKHLLRYLMRHYHSTPFEMCEVKFHVKLPIFVARQWIRHRTANVNEYSARYSIMDKEFYIPKPEHMAAQSTTNRQGRGDVLSAKEAKAVQMLLRFDAEQTYENYTVLLGEKDASGEAKNYLDSHEQFPELDPLTTREYPGLARELARINLTLNTYTQWYWKVDLHNLLNFLSLRADPHAQYEIRVYADAMLQIIDGWVPNVVQAFKDYRLNAFNLSAQMRQAAMDKMNGIMVNDPKHYGMGQREWTEFRAAFNLDAE